MPYGKNKGADQPAFVVRCLDRIIPILAKNPKFQDSS